MSKLIISILTIFGISVVGTGVFFGVNYYENVSNCTVQFISKSPFIECVQNKIQIIRGRSNFDKPLILLYPKKEISVEVGLDYTPGLFATYPAYSAGLGGWEGIVTPESEFTMSGSKYPTYGIFWEGNASSDAWDMSEGFVVRGNDIREFLEEKLDFLGLNTKERSDFIMYWYPKLQDYPYVQIRFAGDDYADLAKLKITPEPDSILRIFMLAKPLQDPISLPEQSLTSFERKGFTVVEWGGTIIK